MDKLTANEWSNAYLTEVARIGLSSVSFEVVQSVALEVWYGSTLQEKDLIQLDGPHKVDALFLVERLAYYNVVPQARKVVLLDGVKAAGGQLNASQNLPLERLFREFLPQLQPLQSRHFQK